MNSWTECLDKANKHHPKCTDIIPELGLIPLPQFTFIQVDCSECETFLLEHFALSMDPNKEGDIYFTSQCNDNGKLIANMAFFSLHGKLTYCIYNNAIENHIKHLAQKNASHLLEIHPEKKLCLFGLFGSAIEKRMQHYFSDNKKVIDYGSGGIVKIDENRYIFALPEDEALKEINHLDYSRIYAPNYWTFLDIQAGRSHVEPQLCAKYSAKSFNQDPTPDAPFHHSFYMVTGIFNQELEPGSLVKKELNNKWMNCGEITTSFRFNDKVTLALAIMPNDLDIETNQFKIMDTNVRVLGIDS